MSDFRPDMTFSWAAPPTTTPSQPQNVTLPTWGAVGSPEDPHAKYDPTTPLAWARKTTGFSGLGAMPYEVPLLYRVATTASVMALVYHGYKRNRGSVGWALMWGIFGGAVWPITVPVALAQGYAKPKAR